jgi:hypothetical protein
MKIKINGNEVVVPFCFEPDKDKELWCSVPQCRFIEECIWKKSREDLSPNLGSDYHGSNMTKPR